MFPETEVEEEIGKFKAQPKELMLVREKMDADNVTADVRYLIRTTSDWTKLKIVDGGVWETVDVRYLKGRGSLRGEAELETNSISIHKAPFDRTPVEIDAKCTLRLFRKSSSDVTYEITKGDIESTSVRIFAQGREIYGTRNASRVAGNPRNPMQFRVPTRMHIPTRMDEQIGSKEYDELETRAKEFKKSERIFHFLTGYWFIAIAIGLALSFIAKNLFGAELGDWGNWAFVVASSTVWFLGTYASGKKLRKYWLEDFEWTIYYTHSMLQHLEKCLKARTNEMKKEYRKNTLKTAQDLLSYIKKRWNVGNFKLARDYFGETLVELKKNIEYRIMSSLKDGDDETLRRVEGIIKNFHAESHNLKLESVKSLNEQMSSELKTTEDSRKIGFRNRVTDFLEVHKIAKHGIFVLTLTIACCIFYYVMVGYLAIIKEYAFMGSVTAFVGILGLYITRRTKQ